MTQLHRPLTGRYPADLVPVDTGRDGDRPRRPHVAMAFLLSAVLVGLATIAFY